MTPDHYHHFVKLTPESDPKNEWEVYCPICNWTKEEAMMIEKSTKSEIPLRDWFAGKALQAIVSSNDAMLAVNSEAKEIKVDICQLVAKISYEYADAMFKERNKE